MSRIMIFLKQTANKFNGPQTMGNSKSFWIALGIGIFLSLLYPQFAMDYSVSNTTYLLVWPFLGLSLCILWGYVNVFSFGQTFFFGVGGYTYGIIAINLLDSMGNTNLAFLGGIIVPMILALIIGYLLFYGGVSGVYIAIFTLMLTLVLEVFLGQTAGLQWRIGKAYLGGYNGMTNIPSLQLGFGTTTFHFVGKSYYYFVFILLILTYLGLRVLVNSKYGHIMVAIRENPKRTEMFGYDIRRIQLGVFTLAGALAGLSSVLYVAWNNYIAPHSIGLTPAALLIVWVAVGGRRSLIAIIISAFVLQYVSQQLAYSGTQYALVILGFLLLGVVMLLPEGLVPSAVEFIRRTVRRNHEKEQKSLLLSSKSE